MTIAQALVGPARHDLTADQFSGSVTFDSYAEAWSISATSWTLTTRRRTALRQRHGAPAAGERRALRPARGSRRSADRRSGRPPAFDATTFATLTAADFSANDQLAKLLGETRFHQPLSPGRTRVDAAVRRRQARDPRRPLRRPHHAGTLRLRLQPIASRNSTASSKRCSRDAQAGAARPILAGADDEIDRLFQ